MVKSQSPAQRQLAGYRNPKQSTGTASIDAASEQRFHIPAIETHLMRSKKVDQTYQIQVMQPLMRRGTEERFPVLYITDGNISFDFAKSIAHFLQFSGQVRRFILVGIGYPGDNPFAGSILRCRDFTSQFRPEVSGLASFPLDGVLEIESGKKRWHGAADFLSFIRDELVTSIDSRYPTIVNDRAYAGDSLGGGLGLHALFSQREIFKHYVITSPSIAYDGDDYGIREAQQFIASGRRLDARLVMTVGELEEFDTAPGVAKPQFVSSFYRLAALLHRAKVPGLDFTCRVYPGETHASVWPMAFSHGVQAIYGPADCPPMAMSA